MPKHIETKKVKIADLRIGMFVTRLEVPWSATEFPLKGMLLTSTQDILRISCYGQTVFVDQKRSLTKAKSQPLKQLTQIQHKPRDPNQLPPRHWRKFCGKQYPVNNTISKEIIKAKKLLSHIDNIFNELKLDMQHIHPKRINEVKAVSCGIVSTILDNPDALLWLVRVKQSKGKVFDHVVRTTVWAITMGRSMGVQQSSLQALAEAILLSSVGKSYLTKNEWQVHKGASISPRYAKWVAITLEKLSHCNVEDRVLTIIAAMAERYDGSGFPGNKSTKMIPYLSQVAGMVESFDLILYPMPGCKKRMFSQSLSRLYCLSDRLFDRELVGEFIQAVGLYPPGTQVLLSNGFQGVVVEHSKARRLRATVALTHEPSGHRMLSYTVARLGEGKLSDVLIKSEAPAHEIVDSDLKRINQLIRKYQQGVLSRMIVGVSNLFERG